MISKHDPNFTKLQERLQSILTVDELILELQNWRNKFPERGERRVVVLVPDGEYGDWHGGIVGVRDELIRSTFLPDMAVFFVEA